MIHGYACQKKGGKLEAFEYDPGELRPDQVEVEIEYSGVCHSDIAMIDNDWGMSQYPFIPGHEGVGKIVAVGDSVSKDRIGKRVGVGWFAQTCQHCKQCNTGHDNYCTTQQAIEQTIVGRNGTFADRVRVQTDWASDLPDGLDPATAGPLMCAGTTVWSPMRHHGVRPGMETAVLGVGGLGHLAVQFLAKMGTQVTGLSTTSSKEDETRNFGATDFIATKENPDALKKSAGRFDFIISTVSADVPWNDYLQLLAPAGTLVLCGIPESDLKIVPFNLVMGERKIAGGSAGSPSDNAEMLQFCTTYGVAPMCEQFDVKEINKAIDHTRNGKARYRSVVAL